ncbi:MAG: phosphoenolpyruvate--protein phosphotransferase [Chlamydiales bacterium]|nr:phosphoenolpyruvate--protein phosphotransferase [Chlamydiales bacterium]
MSERKELVLDGTALSDGIAIGKGHILKDPCVDPVPEFSIEKNDADSEIERYRQALGKSRDELLNLQACVACENPDDATSIIDTHIQMLEDPFITTHVEDRIRSRLQNTEAVFRSVITEYEQQFSKQTNAYFRQRLIDVRDLSQRIMWHLRPKHKRELSLVPKNCIILSEEIVPSDAAEAVKQKAAGFVTHSGGATSHTALIAKSRGLPFVANVDIKSFEDLEIDCVIIDGNKGKVILNPTPDTLNKYTALQTEHIKKYKQLKCDNALPTETRDGLKIDIMANIEHLDDVETILDVSAAGIGLFRSEYLFLEEESAMSESRQCEVYKAILKKASGLPVTFRLFDVGGDKDFYPVSGQATNPALGCRAIRFLLLRSEVMRIQVRALLRAAAGGELRILLPLVSDQSEVEIARRIIHAEKRRLEKAGHEVPEKILIGAMMEVPSAVMMADLLAKECDFFSIGTNDLTQYSLAVDRSDPAMQDKFQPAHPSLLRMIYRIGQASQNHLLPLGLCGDLAADPRFTELLVGLGVRQLSCPPRYIPQIRQAVRKTTLKNAQALAAKAMQASSFDEVLKILKSEGE